MLSVLALLVFAGVWVYSFVTRGQTGYYVRYGGSEISKQKELTLDAGSYAVFEIKNAMGKSDFEYDFLLAANAQDKNFYYRYDGNVVDYAGDHDLTSAFTVEAEPGRVCVYIPEGITMQSVLGAVCAGHEVSEVPDAALDEASYFTLVFTIDRDTVILIDFKVRYENTTT